MLGGEWPVSAAIIAFRGDGYGQIMKNFDPH